ncbi:MAG: AarF/ABC1/UbiB kinase family protein [Deltaproteobacteria bacterium]|jgi:ubiquinone biosynthesis protein|nr:AarF/ABC1/UbiB kinase family protein [Deltaproteobacteria bacterium]
MNLSKKTHRVSNIRRFGVITRLMVKHGLGDILDRILNRNKISPTAENGAPVATRTVYPSPQRIRRVLEELGPSFIKLGQLMSTRADIFPPEYIDELKKLQDQVPPISFEKIKAVIEKELKHPVADIFVSLKQEALAAASVAQVHLAELDENERVVVKVIRPGIDKKIREDIRLMYYFAEKIENSFEIGQIIGFVDLVKEFERSVFRELDMYIEAGNIERFGQNFKDSQELYIPKVHWDYTARSVLVMEHIDGIKMDQVDEIRDNDIDPKEVAMIGLRSFSRQLMEFGLFHADPHPGNTIVMYDGRVSLVDFGITGYLDEETMLQLANIFLGYAEHDYDMIMEALEDAGLISEAAVDLKNFRSDLKDISEPFYGRTLQTISVRDVYEQVMQLLVKYRIRLPRDLMLLLKTFIQTEALGKILGSDASLLEVIRPYAKELLQRGYDAQKLFRNLSREVRSSHGYLRVFPKLFHDLLKGLASGKRPLEIRHRGFQEIPARIERSVNRLTVGLLISASLIAGSLVLNSSQKLLEFTIEFYGVHTLSITAVLGLLGYSMATLLGFWLIISIFRSGKM